MSTNFQLGFQDGASPLMEQLLFFHDHAMLVLIMITLLVGYMMLSLFFSVYVHRFLLEGQVIETVWTIFPAFILIFIALPSLRLLYLLDEVNDPCLTLKVVGHQWYWSYEYSDFEDVGFDSYMIPESDLDLSGFRLLDVDNRLILPIDAQIRILVTASDVLHAWAVPSLGVKVDAIPGRLNQIGFVLSRSGLFYGQCSEICGVNHSFMPIVVEGIESESFLDWLVNYI
uniref:Cytochrome c oxidase subunit 2 n=1 Tax=Hutchinsoniella macracantha TaxID=84335 RepID=Q6SL03_9CRUS|nr:cytochrome c oxidase subunit 2 [Hutchinsoniella macracantha]